MASKVYSPRELVLIVNGAPVRGWNSIELTLPNNRWVMEHDSTGDGLFIENSAYKYFEMTVNTSQQSEANIALSGVYADGTTSGTCSPTRTVLRFSRPVNARCPCSRLPLRKTLEVIAAGRS